jgi:hypothetical protein
MLECFDAQLDLANTADDIRAMVQKYAAPRSTADAIDLQLDLASNRATSLQAPGASDVRGTRTVNLRKLGGAWQADPEEPLNPSNESSAASRR